MPTSVGEFFEGDVHKVGLWFELANPQLGGISPRTMIRADRYKRLLNFMLEARAAEEAAMEAKMMARQKEQARTAAPISPSSPKVANVLKDVVGVKGFALSLRSQSGYGSVDAEQV